MAHTWIMGAAPQSLRQGSQGNDVRALQMSLLLSGYPSIDASNTLHVTAFPNGMYDEGTENAVRAYQRDHGLIPNGTADELTLDKLFGGKHHQVPIPKTSSWFDNFWDRPICRYGAILGIFGLAFYLGKTR